MAQIKVKLSDIPNVSDIEFKDTGYFKSWKALPTPSEVRAQALKQHQAGIITDSRKLYLPEEPHWDPPPVLFRARNLWVKWGQGVRLSEAKSLYIVRKFLPGDFPAPEIYGWHKDDKQVFIYCEWLEGQTLDQAWGLMNDDDRMIVSHELRGAVENLRRLRQDPHEQFIGSPDWSALFDRCFGGFTSQAGPFRSVKAFHDWFAWAYRIRIPGAEEVPIEPFRFELPDDASIKFTHSDLHPSNIILSTSTPSRLLGIVDFEQSGWLPDYWEDRKARWSFSADDEWVRKYLPIIISPSPGVEEAWNWYSSSMGGF